MTRFSYRKNFIIIMTSWPSAGPGIPGENLVKWYLRGKITRKGLVGWVSGLFYKAIPPVPSFLLTALMGQGHGWELLHTETGKCSFPLQRQEKINSRYLQKFVFFLIILCLLTACFEQQRICSFPLATPP